MNILKYNLVLLFFFTGLTKGHSQNSKTIDSLQSAYLHCLDEGSDMTACAKTFYNQVDSMLNVVYHKLQASLKEPEKAALKKDQGAWLLNRDIYFKQNALQLQKNNQQKNAVKTTGRDNAMMMYDANAGFVKQRVIVLIKKMRS